MPPEPKRLRTIGTVILVAGLLGAAAIFTRTSPGDGDPDPYELNANNSKKYEMQLERIGGKSAVLGVEAEDWFTSLWHGRKSAYTVAVISIAGAGICFLFSNLVLLPPAPEEPKRRSERPE